MPSRRIDNGFRRLIIQQDKQLRAEVLKEMTTTGDVAAGWLKLAVQNWRKKPVFVSRHRLSPGLIVVEVVATGDAAVIYSYVDRGTGLYGDKRTSYKIPKTPNPAKPLRFRTGYDAKTQPVARINTGSGQATGNWVTKLQVTHPGIKARKFSEAVWNNLTPNFRSRIENAFRRAARRARS